MRMPRLLLALPAGLTGLLLASAALAQPAPVSGDPLQSPACVEARRLLDAAEAEGPGARPRMAALRERVANACLRASADTPAPSRVARPAEAVPSTLAPAPRVPAPSVLPPPALPSVPQPTQVTRCDAGGCWDTSGQRLNRSGNQLVTPQGQFCSQQGTVLVCR